MAEKRRWPPKQKAFCFHYADCLNGAEAARRAKYSPKTARFKASQLLALPHIRAEINRLIRLQSRMPKEEIISRLEGQAKSDISWFFYKDTIVINPKRVHKRGHLIHSIMITKDGLRLRLYDAQKALELLGKTKALFVERTILDQMEGMFIVDEEDLDGQEVAGDTPPTSSQEAEGD